MKHDLGKVQKKAVEVFDGEVVLIAGNGIVVKRYNPVWEDRPYITSNICYQKDSIKHEYSFHTSTYDQTLEEVREYTLGGLGVL